MSTFTIRILSSDEIHRDVSTVQYSIWRLLAGQTNTQTHFPLPVTHPPPPMWDNTSLTAQSYLYSNRSTRHSSCEAKLEACAAQEQHNSNNSSRSSRQFQQQQQRTFRCSQERVHTCQEDQQDHHHPLKVSICLQGLCHFLFADVSENCSGLIFNITVAFRNSRRWRHHEPSKHQQPVTQWHSIVPQKTCVL